MQKGPLSKTSKLTLDQLAADLREYWNKFKAGEISYEQTKGVLNLVGAMYKADKITSRILPEADKHDE